MVPRSRKHRCVFGTIPQVDLRREYTTATRNEQGEYETPNTAIDDEQDLASSVVKNTAAMTVATMVSRVTGLIRTWAMAFALGNTLMTSAYQVANNLPNVIYDLVAGGLLSAAFLPVLLLELEHRGRAGFNRFGSNILNLCIVVLGALAVVATICAEPLVFTQTFTIDQASDVASTATRFFRIFAVQLLFYGLGGVITGILNARRMYFLAALAPALNNICVIVGFFAYIPLSLVDPNLAFVVLAVLTTAGVAVQFVVQLPALRKAGFTWMPVLSITDPALRETLKIAIPTLVFILANLVAFSCRNAFSLVCGDDGPSMLGYAWMWFQLPYGVVVVSLTRTMFTEMSAASALEDWDALRLYISKGLRGTLFLIIPLAGLMFVLSEPIIGVFRAGAFTQDDVWQVATVLRMWVVGLPFYSVYMYLYSTFASIRKFMTFALLNCALVVVQVILYAILCSPTTLDILGVPLADVLYFCAGAVLSVMLIRKMVGRIDVVGMFVTALKVLVATLIGSVLVALLFKLMPFELDTISSLIELVVFGLVGLVVILAICRVLKVEEFELVEGVVGRIVKRR